jgi:uncharacterized membrane protein YphA (DoxX/SURF4 family)
MSPTNDAAAFLGRLLLSVIFVLSGFQKLAEFSGTVGSARTALGWIPPICRQPK